MTKGYRGHSPEHSLNARGVSTKNLYNKKIKDLIDKWDYEAKMVIKYCKEKQYGPAIAMTNRMLDDDRRIISTIREEKRALK